MTLVTPPLGPQSSNSIPGPLSSGNGSPLFEATSESKTIDLVALTEALNSPEAKNRFEAALDLAEGVERDKSNFLPFLLEQIKNQNASAIWIAGNRKVNEATGVLLKCLNSNDSNIKSYARWALSELFMDDAAVLAKLAEQDPEITDDLIKSLQNEDKVIRGIAAVALYHSKTPQAIKLLYEQLLVEKDEDVALCMANALGNIEHEDAVYNLLLAAVYFDDEIKKVQIAKKESELLFANKDEISQFYSDGLQLVIDKITKKPINVAIEAFKGSKNDEIFNRAVERFLNTSDANTYKIRVKTIGKISDPLIVPLLVKEILKEQNKSYRAQIENILTSRRTDQLLYGLFLCLRDPSIDHKYPLVILKMTQHPEAAKLLVMYMHSPDMTKENRRFAENMLLNMNANVLTQGLKLCFLIPNQEIRNYALQKFTVLNRKNKSNS